jgi:hypothetical protein
MHAEGAALLVDLYQGEQRAGCMLITSEPTELGNEGVLLAGAGFGGMALYDFGVDVAKKLLRNCYAIRTTTARKGLARVLERKHGFKPVDITLRFDHGQQVQH